MSDSGSDQSTDHSCVRGIGATGSYTNFFPTAQARYEIESDLIARAAISSTIARPGFQQVTAATTTDAVGDIITGNPNLKPTTATGLGSGDRTLPAACRHRLTGILREGHQGLHRHRCGADCRRSTEPGRQSGYRETHQLRERPDLAFVWFRNELRAALQRHIARSLGRPGCIRELDLGRFAVHGSRGEPGDGPEHAVARLHAAVDVAQYGERRSVCTTCMA